MERAPIGALSMSLAYTHWPAFTPPRWPGIRPALTAVPVHVGVERGGGDAEPLGDVDGNRLGIGHGGHGHGQGRTIHLAGTPAHATPSPCCSQTGRGAFGYQLALELGKSGEDAKGEPAVGRRGVDLGASAGQHLEADAAQAQVLGRGDQMPKVAAEAIELPEHQGVAGLEGLQACQQAGPGVVSAGCEILVDALLCNAGGEHCVALRGERLAAVALRNPDVADQHGRSDAVRKDSAQPATSYSFPQRVFSRSASSVQLLTTSVRKPTVFLAAHPLQAGRLGRRSWG